MTLVEKCQAILTVYQKILENGGTPYVLVDVNVTHRIRVPMEFVKDGKIVLNISMTSANNLFITEHGIQFGARFSKKHYDVDVPLECVMAVYARESGEGIFFDEPILQYHRNKSEASISNSGTISVQPEQPKKPALRVVK